MTQDRHILRYFGIYTSIIVPPPLYELADTLPVMAFNTAFISCAWRRTGFISVHPLSIFLNIVLLYYIYGVNAIIFSHFPSCCLFMFSLDSPFSCIVFISHSLCYYRYIELWISMRREEDCIAKAIPADTVKPHHPGWRPRFSYGAG